MRLASAVLIAFVVSGCVLPGAPISPHGRVANLQLLRGGNVRGELAAANRDTIWVFSRDGLVAWNTAELRRVHVRRHPFGFERTLKWMGWAGLGTGIALMVSCMSFEASTDGGGESSGCLLVPPVTVGFFAGAGLLFGAINEVSARHSLAPTDTDRLRPFARYPQGIPDSVRMTPGMSDMRRSGRP